LSATGLPAGVTLEGAVIPPESDGTLVTVVPGEETADAAITTWRGRAEGMTERPVLLRGHPLERLQPWLAAALAAAPTTTQAAPEPQPPAREAGRAGGEGHRRRSGRPRPAGAAVARLRRGRSGRAAQPRQAEGAGDRGHAGPPVDGAAAGDARARQPGADRGE